MDIASSNLSPEQDASALVRKLGGMALVSEEEVSYLEGLQANTLVLKRGADFMRDGGSISAAFIIRSGWAARYVLTAEGRRQILSIALPGDVMGLHVNFSRKATYSAMALSELELAVVEPMRILEISQKHPLIGSGLSWFTAREFAILGDQTMRLGRLSAHQRIAHFLAEIYFRLSFIGEVEDDTLYVPMRQADIADTLGLSIVHTNREIMRLRRDGLIETAGREIRIIDINRLCEVGNFDRSHLGEIELSEPLTGPISRENR